MQQFIIEANQSGQRLDKFLHKYLPNATTSFLYKMLRKKNITLNGKKAEGKELLAIGDEICFFFSDETFEKFSGISPVSQSSYKNKAYDTSFTEEYKRAYLQLSKEIIPVLYEDDDVLILNKPAGILTQKAEAGDIS